MNHPYPILFQVQTRASLYQLSKQLNRKATLDDIPDAMLDEWKHNGFEWIWLLGIWNTGEAGRAISRSRPWWWKEFKDALPDLKVEDISGSCFSIRSYTVHPDFGGEDSLARFRQRLKSRGMKLMLDFVPNHTAPDHPWIHTHPDFFMAGDKELLKSDADNYTSINTRFGEKVIAYGRDPNFPGWQDTIQLDYSNPALQKAMMEELLSISDQCDGLRCDMAMLLLPEIFKRTWNKEIQSFWPDAIRKVKHKNPDFLFLAEVYWDLEWEMQQNGFDYCYDKRLYDRLENPDPTGIKEHFWAGMDYQDGLTRFLENHDEPRAAASFQNGKHLAAAILTYFSPGMKFFQQGQMEGYKVRIPVHLNRGPEEKVEREIVLMYDKVLSLLKNDSFRSGKWELLESHSDFDQSHTSIISFYWYGPGEMKHLIAVNYSPDVVKGIVKLTDADLCDNIWRLTDLLTDVEYLREGNALFNDGLYLELKAWGVHVFRLDRS